MTDRRVDFSNIGSGWLRMEASSGGEAFHEVDPPVVPFRPGLRDRGEFEIEVKFPQQVEFPRGLVKLEVPREKLPDAQVGGREVFGYGDFEFEMEVVLVSAEVVVFESFGDF